MYVWVHGCVCKYKCYVYKCMWKPNLGVEHFFLSLSILFSKVGALLTQNLLSQLVLDSWLALDASHLCLLTCLPLPSECCDYGREPPVCHPAVYRSPIVEEARLPPSQNFGTPLPFTVEAEVGTVVVTTNISFVFVTGQHMCRTQHGIPGLFQEQILRLQRQLLPIFFFSRSGRWGCSLCL